jgi:hypothetical protein
MTGRLDVPSFVLSENSDLRIALDLSGLKNKSGLFRLFVRHGGAPVYTFAFTQKEPVATLPCEWLKQGGTEYLEFSLKQYNDIGTTLINGGYMIEPCIVTAEEGCFAVTSIIQELIDKVAALREELNEALDTHRNAVASELAGFEERLETNISTFNETIESFKSGVAGELESCRIDLEQVSATSDRVLSKMQEYVDNGAEVTFKE